MKSAIAARDSADAMLAWVAEGIRWRCVALSQIKMGPVALPSTKDLEIPEEHDLLLACFAAGSGRASCVSWVGLSTSSVGAAISWIGIRAASSSINDLPKRSITRSALWRSQLRGRL